MSEPSAKVASRMVIRTLTFEISQETSQCRCINIAWSTHLGLPLLVKHNAVLVGVCEPGSTKVFAYSWSQPLSQTRGRGQALTNVVVVVVDTEAVRGYALEIRLFLNHPTEYVLAEEGLAGDGCGNLNAAVFNPDKSWQGLIFGEEETAKEAWTRSGLEICEGLAKHLVHLPVFLLACGRAIACIATGGTALFSRLFADEAGMGSCRRSWRHIFWVGDL